MFRTYLYNATTASIRGEDVPRLADIHTISAYTLTALSIKAREWMKMHNISGSAWPTPDVLLDGKRIGYMASNGTIWPGSQDDRGPDTKPLLDSCSAELQEKEELISGFKGLLRKMQSFLNGSGDISPEDRKLMSEINLVCEASLDASQNDVRGEKDASLKRNELLELHLREALGAMDNLAHQIDQMRGMFRDEDGAIEKSIDDYEATAAEIRAVLQPNTSARKHLNPG